MHLVASPLRCLKDLPSPSLLQLVELSKAQDVEAGDGTTTVVVIAGSLLNASQKLLAKGEPVELATSLLSE